MKKTMKTMRWLALLLCLALSLSACGLPALKPGEPEQTAPAGTAAPAETAAPAQPGPAAAVRMERADTETEEYVLIRGLDAAGETVWLRSAGPMSKGQLSRIQEIGLWQDRYYFNYGGSITCLALASGELLWTNGEFRGGSLSGQIGDEFGGKDHSTVLYGVKKIKREMERNSALRNTVEDIIKNVREVRD